MSERDAAGRLVGNVMRAVKAGNCLRAERIITDREFYLVQENASLSTLRRVRLAVHRCWQRKAAA